jgi:long-chain acyl-CoA synthetase
VSAATTAEDPATGSSLDRFIDALTERGQHPLLQQFQAQQSQRHTYGQIGEQVLALARGVQRRVEPGEAVALLGSEGPAWIIAALAILRSGAVVMPLDVQLGDDTLAHVLEDSGVRWIFTTTRQRERLTRQAPQAHLVMLDEEDEEARVSWRSLMQKDGSLPANDSAAPAALFYTSGTTGPPKGVPLSHANLAFQLDTLARTDITHPGDRVLLPLPLHHVYPFVIGMLGPLSLGLTLVIPYALTGPQLMRAIRDGHATVIIAVPRLYRSLFDGITARVAQRGRMARALFQGLLHLSLVARKRWGVYLGRVLFRPLHAQMGGQLRVLASGGSALDPSLAWQLEALGWQVAVGYGLTETAPLLTVDPPGQLRPGTVGKAVPGVELRIDPQAAPEGSKDGEGEILARGPNIFAGYRNQPDKTRAVLSDDGWFRSGDLGWLDADGYLHVSGRVSTLIVTEGGENIQPDELEARYAEHPAIKELGILQRNNQLAALIVPSAGGGDNMRARIRDAVGHIAAELPSYQRLAEFALSAKPLPRTRLGKIQRHSLEQRYEQAQAEGDQALQREPLALEEMSAEDRNLLEHPAVRRSWEWLAQRYPKRGLTPDSHLQLELGVDSLEWLNLTLELGQRTGVELSDEAIGRIETVRDLWQELIDARGGAATLADPIEHPERVLDEKKRRWLQPRHGVVRASASTLYGLNRLLMRGLFRLRVYGREQLPEQGPMILACNHASYLDPFAVGAALPTARLHTLYWGGWTGVAFSNPLTLMGSRIVQIIPIDPEQGVRSSLALAAAVLERDQGLIWFPEGGRSPSGELQDFRRGIGMLLQRFSVPVVPVYIRGSEKALPLGRRLPRLTSIKVHFDAALDPKQLAQQGEGEDEAARIVAALHRHMARGLAESGRG